jgi:hypothetical protein
MCDSREGQFGLQINKRRGLFLKDMGKKAHWEGKTQKKRKQRKEEEKEGRKTKEEGKRRNPKTHFTARKRRWKWKRKNAKALPYIQQLLLRSSPALLQRFKCPRFGEDKPAQISSFFNFLPYSITLHCILLHRGKRQRIPLIE